MTSDWRVRRLLLAADASLACVDGESFYRSLQKQVTLTHEMLTQPAPDLDPQAAISAALESARNQPGRRRMLELSLVPLYDKPLLPDSGGEREFLWVFVIPVRITFAVDALDARPLELPGEAFDAQVVLNALHDSRSLQAPGTVRLFSCLWQREELSCIGSRAWARAFVHNELYDEPVAPPRAPLALHPEFPLNRTRSFYILGAARCVQGTKTLFSNERDPQFCDITAASLHERIAAAGIPLEDVCVFEAGSFATAYLVGESSWQSALHANLQDAREHGAVGASVQFPSPNHTEVYAWDESERKTLIAPASLTIEPKPEIVRTVFAVAQAAELKWCGSSSSQHNTVKLLH